MSANEGEEFEANAIHYLTKISGRKHASHVNGGDDLLNIGVLASTKGTDLQAVIDEIEAGKLDAKVSCVISNKKDAYALERARKHGIDAIFIDPKNKTREEFDNEVVKHLEEHGVDLILLIGYMRFLTKPFVEKYRNRIMNIHPSLLPAFAGGMDRNVHKDVLDHGCKVSGCTLHFVDEGADTGPIILQMPIPVQEDDDVESLRDKVQSAEQSVILQAIRLFGEGKLRVEGRRVKIEGFDQNEFQKQHISRL